MGKTSKRRPQLVSRTEFEENWDRTFHSKKAEEPEPAPEPKRRPLVRTFEEVEELREEIYARMMVPRSYLEPPKR